jgi:hypothetical protein
MTLVLALLRQILSDRSIVEVARRPLNHLTEQAEFALGEVNEARRLAAFPSRTGFAAASPQSLAAWPKWPMVIW